MVKFIEEEITLKLQRWGIDEVGISCILQMDVDGNNDEPHSENSNPSLKFMIVTDRVNAYMSQSDWLELFGPYTKCHKANHGFFQIIKTTYASGVTMSFVMIEGNDKKDVYTFCEIEDLEKSVKILVCKN